MPTITDGTYFQLNGTTFSIVTLKDTSATVINSGSFNGHLGYAYALDTNNHTYQIQYNNAKVQFIIDGKLLHTVTASTTTWADTINLHIWMEVYNTGNSAAVAMYTRNAGLHRHGRLTTQPTSLLPCFRTDCRSTVENRCRKSA